MNPSVSLAPNRFAVAFARMAQDDPEQMRTSAFAVLHHPRALAKIHLRLGSGFHFHPRKRHWLGLTHMAGPEFCEMPLLTHEEEIILTTSASDALEVFCADHAPTEKLDIP